MAFDIEFLPVDGGEKSGDAIVLRWSEGNVFKVGVVDGGTKESGQAIVNHIKKYYGSVSELEFVLNTHPDSDHCSGLTVVLENFRVKTLWMHLPWTYSTELLDFISDDRITDDGLEKKLRDKLAKAHELEQLAIRKGATIRQPFQGEKVGPLTVLSPSQEWYKELVCQFRNMPNEQNSFSAGLIQKAGDLLKRIAESIHIETLREDGQTSAENNSSAILYGNLEGRSKVLLTGDAGVEALTKAADYADILFSGWNQNLNVIQIPHHGSRRNVSPTILNRILGEKVQDVDRGWAYVSASKDSTTHPKKSVLNAFHRRGYKCCATQGQTKRHYRDTGEREGWSAVRPLPFYDEVEDYN